MKMVFEMVEWSVLKCYLNLLVLEHHDYVLRIEYWGEATFIVDMFHRVNKEYDWFSTIINSDNECDGLRDAMVWATEQVVSSTNEWYANVECEELYDDIDSFSCPECRNQVPHTESTFETGMCDDCYDKLMTSVCGECGAEKEDCRCDGGPVLPK